MTTEPNNEVATTTIDISFFENHKLTELEVIEGLRILLPGLDFKTQIELKKLVVETHKFVKLREWNVLVAQAKVIHELGKYPNSIEDLLETWLENNNYAYNIKTASFRKTKVFLDGMEIPHTPGNQEIEQFRQVKLSAQQAEPFEVLDAITVWMTGHRILGYARYELEATLSVFIKKKLEEQTIELMNGITYRLCDRDVVHANWTTFVENFFDMENNEYPVNKKLVIAILQKFIYQVKRKGLGLQVKHHLMPIFIGPQGCGKSWMLKNLLGPIDPKTAEIGFDAITDPKQAKVFKDNWVLFLDEMANANKAEWDTVKSRITSEVVTYRPMRTNNTVAIKNNATLIGAANNSFSSMIRDETGNRRFFPLYCINSLNEEENEKRWKKLNQIDWMILWHSVNENGPDPSEDFLSEINSIQKEIKTKSCAELWIETLKGNMIGNWHKTSFLYESFKEWANHYGSQYEKSLGIKEFGRILATEAVNNPRVSRKTVGGYTVVRIA